MLGLNMVKPTLKDKVKAQLNNRKVAEILSFIGYPITKDFKFADNPSMSISKDGYIKDFGNSSFNGGDLFDYLQHTKNISLNEAVRYVADCLGVSYE